jgi:tRNA U34 2-thiouridine synthase MnmA/TrmU
MSGGVDSSVAAWLMLQQQFDCAGGTMRLHDFGCGGDGACGNSCVALLGRGIRAYHP